MTYEQRKANLVAGKAVVIKARVPIIKCDLRSGVAVDVSLGAANGAAAVRFIHKQVRFGGLLRGSHPVPRLPPPPEVCLQGSARRLGGVAGRWEAVSQSHI